MEEYKVIDGFSKYEVSNMGNVRNRLTGKCLKQGLNNGGYYHVSLVSDCKKSKTLRVHRLVAGAFIDNPHNKKIVDHINNVRNDNRRENLRWATNHENGANQKMSKNNTSGYKGLRYDTSFNKWVVDLPYNSFGSRYTKLFECVDDAIIDRVEQMKLRYGDYVNEGELMIYNEALIRRNNKLLVV
jgi:hypothetical protein